MATTIDLPATGQRLTISDLALVRQTVAVKGLSARVPLQIAGNQHDLTLSWPAFKVVVAHRSTEPFSVDIDLPASTILKSGGRLFVISCRIALPVIIDPELKKSAAVVSRPRISSQPVVTELPTSTLHGPSTEVLADALRQFTGVLATVAKGRSGPRRRRIETDPRTGRPVAIVDEDADE